MANPLALRLYDEAQPLPVLTLPPELEEGLPQGANRGQLLAVLREAGADEVIIRATASHGYGLCCDIEPQSQMEKVLFTIDELSGLITAAALMRPSHSVMDMELKSVKKKFKDKRFAAGVNREVILQGVERLGMDLDTVITETIKGMQKVAEAIGLGLQE